MPRERLSPLDASFLYMDGEVSCNQGVGYQVADGPIDFDRLLEEMKRKVRYVDRLRQSAVFSPLNLFQPTWEFDPAFDIRNHVKRVVIDPRGDEMKYKEVISRIFYTPLDRAHPLWAVYVVDGRPDGRSAYLVVIHHSVSDGIGFARISTALFDADRNLDLEPFDPPQAPPLPSPLSRIGYGIVDAIRAWPKVVLLIVRGVWTLLRSLMSTQGRRAWRLFRQFKRAPGVTFAFNAPLSGEASFAFAQYRLDDIARIRAAHGGTLNDVLLAMVGCALHRYAIKHGIKTEGKFLRVLVPSNVRSVDTRDKLGNFVSMAPVLVPLGDISARDRLKAVTEYTREMKECGLARMLSLGIALAQSLLTPPVSRLVHHRHTSLRLQKRNHAKGKTPAYNLVVTNVPGSPHPSYAAGRELRDTHVLVPLLPLMGLVCGALSHDGTLFVSFTGDKATVPDVEVLSEYLDDAFTELRTT